MKSLRLEARFHIFTSDLTLKKNVVIIQQSIYLTLKKTGCVQIVYFGIAHVMIESEMITPTFCGNF